MQIKCAPHQWPRGSALKTGRQVVPGSNPDRAYRPSHSEFSVDFSEIRENTGQDLLDIRHSSRRSRFHVRTIALNPITQSNPHQICVLAIQYYGCFLFCYFKSVPLLFYFSGERGEEGKKEVIKRVSRRSINIKDAVLDKFSKYCFALKF